MRLRSRPALVAQWASHWTAMPAGLLTDQSQWRRFNTYWALSHQRCQIPLSYLTVDSTTTTEQNGWKYGELTSLPRNNLVNCALSNGAWNTARRWHNTRTLIIVELRIRLIIRMPAAGRVSTNSPTALWLFLPKDNRWANICSHKC